MERREMMSEEEVEGLLRRQARRMPPAALWARVEAAQRARRPNAWMAWAGAAAVAVIGVMLVVAMSGRGAGREMASGGASGEVRAAKTVAAPPGRSRQDAWAPRAVQAGSKAEAPDRSHATLIRHSSGGMQCAASRKAAKGRGSAAVGAQFASGGSSPPKAVAPSAIPVKAETPAPAVVEAEAPAAGVPEQNADTSSYYVEVSRGGTGSALSGSVKRDAWGNVTEIEMAYDPVKRDAVPGS